MHRYLTTLNEDQPERSTEEYLGAFTESLKLIQQETPVERMGHAVLLAAKTALRLKAVMPKLQEHEIARRLQSIARGIRLFEILKDLTPEEKGMIKFNHKSSRRAAAKPRARRSVPRRRK
jgi:hypothetical protein